MTVHVLHKSRRRNIFCNSVLQRYQLQIRKIGYPLSIEEVALPCLESGQVLVRMQLAGVCHTQKLEVSGSRGPDRFLPHLLGHEGVGVVDDIGPGVTKAVVGDQVVLSWIRGKGMAIAPVQYTSSQGAVNAGPIATFCEKAVVSEQCVTRVHPVVPPEDAVLAGCAIPTGAGTVWNAMPGGSQNTVGIIGAGGVGLSAVCGAIYAGWGRIIVIDLHDSRLTRALALGAGHIINAGTEDVEETVLRITQGVGCDLVVECAGAVEAMEVAVRIAKPKGGKVVIAGNVEVGTKFSLDPFDLIKGRWVGGSWGGGITPEEDIPQIVRLVETGKLNGHLLLGRRYPLDAVNEAIASLSGEDPGRPVIAFA